jgi:hypothetical protein
MYPYRLALLAEQNFIDSGSDAYVNLENAVTWLNQSWKLTKPAEADYIFMLASSTNSLKTLQTLQQNYPKEKLIVATSMQVELPQIKWQLSFPKKNSFPSVLSIVNLLTRIIETNQSDRFVKIDVPFDPGQYLPAIIKQAEQDRISRLCKLTSAIAIVIYSSQKVFYSKGNFDYLVPLAAANKSNLTVQKISDRELPNLIGSPMHGQGFNEQHEYEFSYKRDLNDLVWFSVLVASQGNPLKSYTANHKISLLEIPDILLMDYFADEYRRLAEILISKPTSPIEASQSIERSLYDVINFCNACTVLGMTEIIR